MRDVKFMEAAIEEAQKALTLNENIVIIAISTTNNNFLLVLVIF